MNADIVSKPTEFMPFEGQEIRNESIDVDASAPNSAPGHARDDSDASGVFDTQVALDRVEGNRELLRRMVRIFSRQWRDLLAEIASAANRRDGAALELLADRLKRSLSSIGAGKASRVAQGLEELGCQRGFQDIEGKRAQLAIEIERLVKALKEFGNELGWAAPARRGQ